MPRLDDKRVDITEKDIKDALAMPRDFGYSGHLPIGESWSLGPVVLTRDSDLLEESNHAALIKHLESDKSLAKDWEIVHAGHWAVGWVDHLAFRAVNKKGEPTRMFRVMTSWFNALAGYPVADDSDYSQRQYDATLANIEQAGGRFVAEGAPKDWPDKVFGWFLDNDPEEAVESRDGGGGYPSDNQLKAALSALGWLEE